MTQEVMRPIMAPKGVVECGKADARGRKLYRANGKEELDRQELLRGVRRQERRNRAAERGPTTRGVG